MSEARSLSDADLEALEASEGIELAVTTRPYVEYATVDTMRNFARAYGDDNPLFGDEAYGKASVWTSIVAPPLFAIATGTPVVAAVEPAAALHNALRGVAVGVISDRWMLKRPVLPGTRLVRADSIAAVDIEEHSPGTMTAVITTRSTYTVGDALYAVHDRVRVHGGRSIADADAAHGAGPRRDGKAHYDDDALAEIEHLSATWRRRGAAPVGLPDLVPGKKIGPLVKGPMTVTDLVAYRGGVGPGPFDVEPLELGRRNRMVRPDFYDRDDTGGWDARERLHYDEAYARRCRHPTAYDYTHTRLNWMVHLLTDWMGDRGFIETITFAHDVHNYVGDTHWIDATIDALDTSREFTRVELQLRGTNQLGVLTCQGFATVAFLPMAR